MSEKKKEKIEVDMGSVGTAFRPIEYPSNSRKSKQKQLDQPKVKKVITGSVKKRKKPLGKRFAETFLGEEDILSVTSYIIHDILIPAAKNTLYEMIVGGSAMSLFGEVRKSSARGGVASGSHVRYGSYYNSPDPRGSRSQRTHPRHSIDEIILDSRVEADEVLHSLADLIDEYGRATIGDLYDLLGVTRTMGSFTDDKYGWKNLNMAEVRRVREGYLLDLPRPIAVD